MREDESWNGKTLIALDEDFLKRRVYKMKRVLLTNAMGPYESGWGQDVNDLFAARLSRGQGPFTLKGYFHAFALHLLAENLDAETTNSQKSE